MIICKECDSKMKMTPGLIECESCKNNVLLSDGIFSFINDRKLIDDYDEYGLEVLHRAEESHFWFLNRKKVIVDIFKKYIDLDFSIIEVGAGTGNVSKAIYDAGYSNVTVGEIYKKGLEYAKGYGLNRLFQFDLFENPFEEHYDAIGMFDVLEHLENEKAILDSLNTMLKPGGFLIITVPAHQFLWSKEDDIAKHKRRYNISYLKSILLKSGFEALEIKHFFVSILPLLLLRKFIYYLKKENELKNSQIKMNKTINTILNIITGIEYRLIRNVNMKIGGSIIAVAQKK